jgi:hypothetical protein
LFPLAALALLTACSAAEPAGEPRLIEVGMVVLEEGSEAVGLGRPTGFGTDPDGGYYLTDAMNYGVLRFAPDGRLVRKYGRGGEGPGEFSSPSLPHVLDDSTLLVSDMGNRSVSEFDRRDGRFRDRQSRSGLITGLARHPQGIVLAVASPDSRFRLHRVVSLRDAGEEIHQLAMHADLPTMFAAVYPFVALLSRGDSLLAGIGVSNTLYLLVRDHPLATLDLPRVHRVGVPAELPRLLKDAASPMAWAELFSVQWALLALGSRTGVIHYDMAWSDPSQPLILDQYSTVSRLTVLREDLTQACADLVVPYSAGLYPFVASRGDTLLVLDHHDTGDDIQTVVRKFLVETDGCDWQPVRRASANN